MSADPIAEPGTVRVTFVPTEADMIAAYRRHNLDLVRSRRTLVSLAVCLVVAGVALWILIPDDPVPRLVIWVFAALAGAVAPAAAIRWRVPGLARRIYAQQADLHRPITVTAASEGLEAEAQNGHSRTPWTDYLRWREDARVILLYRSDVLFQFIPKRVLSAAQIDAVRGLWEAARAEARVGRPDHAPPRSG